MGASGNLCASVYVSIDENAEATRAVTANVSSYRSLGPARIMQRAWAEKPDLWKLWVLKCGKCYVHCVFWNKFSENLHFQWLSPLRLRQNRWRRDLLRVIVELSGPWESLLLRKKICFFQDVISCKKSTVTPFSSFFLFFFFAFSYFSWGSQVKNTEVVCLSLLQWIMFCLTQWTWVWENSRRWWKTEKPGVLQFMGLQEVGHNIATKQQWVQLNYY